MRIKALLRYSFSTYRNSIVIFFLCFVGAMMVVALINSLFDNVTIFNVTTTTTTNYISDDGLTTITESFRASWLMNIASPIVFIFIAVFCCYGNDARFLISRSVSRKEIFLSDVLFLPVLAAMMSLVQLISIYGYGIVYWIGTSEWLGLSLDVQYTQAPDMNNAFVFFLVSFSMLLSFASLNCLLGALIARWKVQTIVVAGVLFIGLITLMTTTNLGEGVGALYFFMFTDDTTGLMIVLKQIIFAACIMLITYPIMRRITAAKQ